MEDRKIYSREAAEIADISYATWRRYSSESKDRRRQTPPPDGTDDERGHARPWWRASTIEAWKKNRPGRGAPGRPRTRKPATEAPTDG